MFPVSWFGMIYFGRWCCKYFLFHPETCGRWSKLTKSSSENRGRWNHQLDFYESIDLVWVNQLSRMNIPLKHPWGLLRRLVAAPHPCSLPWKPGISQSLDFCRQECFFSGFHNWFYRKFPIRRWNQLVWGKGDGKCVMMQLFVVYVLLMKMPMLQYLAMLFGEHTRMWSHMIILVF